MTDEVDAPTMVRLRDAQRILNVGQSKIRQLAKAGEIRTVRYADSPTAPIWVYRDSVFEYLERRTAATAA